MFGASAIDTCSVPRDALPRALSQTCIGVAASLRAPSAVRRRSVRVFAAAAASCEVQEDRRRFLLNYVQKVDPQIMEQFVNYAPDQVVDAMRTTISNMVGVLPPQLFEVTVSTKGESLAQLMFSVLMTGYLFRNAQYRLDLQRSIDEADGSSLPAKAEAIDTSEGPYNGWDGFHDSSQTKHVEGHVLRWHEDHGTSQMPATEYIAMLEKELTALRKQVSLRHFQSQHGNELLDYLKGLDVNTLSQLTACAGDDIIEAMNAFIHRLLGSSDEEDLRRAPSQSNAVELARLLFWLMCVGYGLRTLEVRFDMEQTMLLDERDPGAGSYLPD